MNELIRFQSKERCRYYASNNFCRSQIKLIAFFDVRSVERTVYVVLETEVFSPAKWQIKL